MLSKTNPHDQGVARLVEKRMRNWEIARTQRAEESAPQVEAVQDFVTIGNIVGAGGNEVAALLADKLKWPVFDRQILTTMAGDDEARARFYRSVDERDLGWFENMFRALMEEAFCKNDYFSRLIETIFFLARQGPAIFVGRAADLILPKSKGLRVKLIASPQYCARNFAKRSGATIEHARHEVQRIERERRDFIWNHFQIDAYEPTRFDMLINVERFSTRQVVDLILSALRIRTAAGSYEGR